MVDIVTRLGKGSPLTNAEVDANFTNLAEVSGVTGEPMGHEDRTTSTISFNASTRTFTIAPVASSFTVWCKGKKVVVSSAQTVTIPNTTGMYSIYYDANGVLSAKSGYFTFSLEAPTAYVYWNATTGTCPYFGDERHGVVLDWQTHEYLHRTRGAALASGFAASGYVLGGNGSSNSHAQITLDGGTFFDEDMKIIVTATNTPTAGTWEQDLLSPARIPVLYLSGTAWVIDSPTDYPLKQGTARPQYNAYSGGVWSTADVTNNKYATTWILATNNLTYPVIAIIGQAQNDSQSAAEAVDFTELQLPGFPSVEFRPLYKLIFQCADSCSNAVHASLVSITDIRSIAAAGTAASIVTDHGNLSGLSDDDHPQYIHVDTLRTVSAAVKASFLPSQTSNTGKFLQTDGTATSWAALTSSNVTTALGFTPYNATNPSGYISGITSGMVTTALGFTPYNATNPSGYVTAAGARGAISVTGAGSYDSATGVINIVGGVTSFNTRTGAITLSSADVTTALGFTPYNNTNPSGYITGITSTMVTTALGFTPYNSSNPNGYISSITSANVTTALGFTPYNATNPSGYITSSALSGYLTSASAASTYLPLAGGTLTGAVALNDTKLYLRTNGDTNHYLWNAADDWEELVAWTGTGFRVASSTGTTLATFTTSAVNAGVALQQGGNQVLHAGNYTSYSPSLTGSGASGTWGISISGNAATATSATGANQVNSDTSSKGSALQYWQTYGNTTLNPDGDWHWAIRMSHGDAETYYSATLAIPFGSDALYFRRKTNGTNQSWISVLHSTNYSSYAMPSGSSATNSVDVRAPIFYDSNNTSFFVNPNGASNILNATIGYNGQTYAYEAGANGKLYFGTSGGDASDFYHIATTMQNYGGNYSKLDFKWYTGQRFYAHSAYGGFRFHEITSGTQIFSINEGGSFALANQSMRAPIFYDSDNTNYYVDPASATSGSFAGFVGIGNNYGSDDGGWGSRLNVGGGPHARIDVRCANDGIVTTMYSHAGQGVGKMGMMSNHPLVLMAQGAAEGGYVYSGSLRSAIFYDSQNTGYYVDPNSTSTVLNMLIGASSWYVPASRLIVGSGSGTTSAQISWESNGYYTGSVAMTSAGAFVWGGQGSSSWDFRINCTYNGDYSASGSSRFSIDSSGNSTSVSSSRAPIFYDTNDTGFYLDPQGGSRLNALSLNTVSITAGVTSLTNAPIVTQQLQVGTTNTWLPMTYQRALHSGGYITHLNTGLYKHASGWGDNVTGWYAALGGSDSSPTMEWRLTYGTDIYNSVGYVSTPGSFRAPIFYDSNDTSRYVDPTAATSAIFTGSVDARTHNYAGLLLNASGTGSAGSSIGMQQVTGEGWTGIFVDYEPNAGWGLYHDNPNNYFCITAETSAGNFRSFTVPSRYSGNRTAYEKIRFDQNNGDIISGNISYAYSSSRAPIFYDYDDTGYYCNPNSFSQLSYANLNAAPGGRTLSLGGDQTNRVYNDSARASLVINATQYPHLYINATTNINNVYHGAVFSMTGNLTGGGYRRWGMGIANTDPDCFSWGYADNDSNPHYGVGGVFGYTGTYSKMWLNTGGSLMTTGDMRAPIFYDSNDTGYYTNPNGLSNLWELQLTGASHKYLYLNPGNGYEAMVRYNGGSGNGWYVGKRTASVIVGTESFHFYSEAAGATVAGIDTAGNLLTSGSLRAPIFYDTNNTGTYLDPNGTSNFATTVTGYMYFMSNRNTTSDSPPLQAFSSGGGGAIMSFHRGGYYAVNFGLDSDNVMRIGGWSAGANRWQLDMSGNMTVAGNVTAYSDERLKKDWSVLPSNFIEQLAQVKSGTYTRIDSEERQVGVSAQGLQKFLKEAVQTDVDGMLSVNYGGAALASAVELAKEVVDLRNRVAQLESLITKLIGD